MPDEPKDLDHLKPIDHAVVAKPHTPVYKMHRYFARRPWSVFRELILHYSNPGSVILDPFCGGGVTVVEGLRLGRKVIGVDINPLATFITRMEVADVDPDDLQRAFGQLEAACRNEIESLYLTSCPNCGKDTPADWFEWSNVYECPACGQRSVISEMRKAGSGVYECVNKRCKTGIRPLAARQLPPVITCVRVECDSCGCKRTVPATERDHARFRRIARSYETIVQNEDLPVPSDPIPDGNMARENALFKRNIRHFADFFTKRNLLANGRLKKHILNLGASPRLMDFLGLAFSGSLRFTNRMVFRNAAWRGDKPLEWAKPAFWIPETSLEANVWAYFVRRLPRIKQALKYMARECPVRVDFATSFEDLCKSRNALILTQSSDSLPFPDQSVDAIITDPPYGSNVQYAELSDFWVVWLGEWLGTNGIIDNAKEAITTRYDDFEGAKDSAHYRNMLFRVFQECHRVLKPNRWMTMTFHNREFEVWSATHMAAHDAGFVLAEHDGLIYQPAIKLYEHTINTRRSGSMLGDFVLSFQKRSVSPSFRVLDHLEIGKHIQRLAAEAVLHHKGATLSVIYMKLMPWLLNNNLLERISEKEVVPYLQRNFREHDGVWYLVKDLESGLREYLEEYSWQHYKAALDEMTYVPVEARLEFLIRRYLYAHGSATQDDILNEVYANLINSNAAEYGEINRVLTRLAELVSPPRVRGRGRGRGGRKVWRLKEDVERERLFKESVTGYEESPETKEESDHDLAISRLAEIAGLRGLKTHIGKTEQTKYTYFRSLTSDLPRRVAGMPRAAREIVEQIDVLWHNGGRGLVAAFEVERTTTITSGIERFRNLLAAAPEVDVALYLVVPRSRERELRSTLGSPANRRDGLHRRIGFIFLEDLQITARDASKVRFEEIIHQLPEGGG